MNHPTGRFVFRGLPATLGGLALAAALVGAAACADSDVAKGALTFQRCYACHSIGGNERLSGPALRGVFGRRAGTLSGYEYSSALREAGQRGLIWTTETLDRFLEDPEEMIPGVRMGGRAVTKSGRAPSIHPLASARGEVSLKISNFEIRSSNLEMPPPRVNEFILSLTEAPDPVSFYDTPCIIASASGRGRSWVTSQYGESRRRLATT